MYKCKNNFDVDDIHAIREEYSKMFENMSPSEIINFIRSKANDVTKNIKNCEKESIFS